MKKSSSIIIFILLLLAGVSIYIYKAKSKPGTLDEESRNFKYRDTAAITRIFLADKDGHKSDLKRTKTGWVVNDKYNCRGDAILNLLEVIKLVEVKNPVPKTMRESTLKYMAAQAIKVEIYTGDERVRQYYVGHETDDSEGSYMLLSDPENGENYKDPYVCFIAGFKGFLMPRYIVNENEWRDRLVLNYTPPEMKQISFQNYEAPADSSFVIDLINANTFSLKNGKGQQLTYDDARMRQYLVYLQNISYEVLLTNKSKKLQDSLMTVKPFSSLTITTKDNKVEKYNFFRKQYTNEDNPEHGVTYYYDPDRLFLSFNNDGEWALIQYFVFGKLFVTSNYFSAQSSVKK
ncbi:hypothetical protein CNR22_05345 [Sphingobacteriaceae bacterium]|nr:hypothetical protein CNR22_05345 [Sphingobacteriaceae bacterium]